MKFDLHIHTCLSPCADLAMGPREIVARACAAGLDGIAVTDHQSARNAPAVMDCARRAGLTCLAGLEIQTAEEVHTLALFDTAEAALALSAEVADALPRRPNDPDTFGEQPVVTADEEIVAFETRLLAAGCRLTLEAVAARVRALGGLYLAAHIDRAAFSVVAGLGAIPSGVFDALELSRTADPAAWTAHTAGYACVRSSDAHYPGDIARAWTEADGTFSVAGLKDIFARRATRLSERIVCF